MLSLTVVIPTIGRASLAAAIESARDADEIIVVVDDAKIGGEPPLPRHVKILHVRGGDHGYTARTAGMNAATSTHIAFLDDDDVYAPGAISHFRAHACDQPVVFRMDHPNHGILWRDPVLRFGNVGTPMILIPNQPDKFGTWAPHSPGLPEPGGDFTFLTGCVKNMGDPVWREEIVATIRPDFTTVSVVTPWVDHPELWQDYGAAVTVRSHRDELLVVDNGSTPPAMFAAVRLDRNEGFAAGSNTGLREATGDAVLFLNNDIRMVRPDWLDAIRAALEPGVLVGAEMRHDAHGIVDGQPLPYLDGWCLAGMRQDLLELGGFDEEYQEPSYFGDNDLCLRARAAGMTLREVKVGLRHLRNVTSGGSGNPTTMAAMLANQERFVRAARAILDPKEVAA